MAGNWHTADPEHDDLKVGTHVRWRGTRLAAYFGRIVAATDVDYALSCDEDGRVIWKIPREFEVLS